MEWILIKSVPIKQLINSGFEEILEVDYRAIFQHGLFDKIDFDNNPFAVQLTATNLVLKDLSNKTDNINIIERDSLVNLNGDSVQANLIDTNESYS